MAKILFLWYCTAGIYLRPEFPVIHDLFLFIFFLRPYHCFPGRSRSPFLHSLMHLHQWLPERQLSRQSSSSSEFLHWSLHHSWHRHIQASWSCLICGLSSNSSSQRFLFPGCSAWGTNRLISRARPFIGLRSAWSTEERTEDCERIAIERVVQRKSFIWKRKRKRQGWHRFRTLWN